MIPARLFRDIARHNAEWRKSHRRILASFERFEKVARG